MRISFCKVLVIYLVFSAIFFFAGFGLYTLCGAETFTILVPKASFPQQRFLSSTVDGVNKYTTFTSLGLTTIAKNVAQPLFVTRWVNYNATDWLLLITPDSEKSKAYLLDLNKRELIRIIQSDTINKNRTITDKEYRGWPVKYVVQISTPGGK